jgi:hypothetical protein
VDLIQNRQVTKAEHEKFVRSNSIVQSGLFMSARSGDNVVKAFYKVQCVPSERISKQTMKTLYVCRQLRSTLGFPYSRKNWRFLMWLSQRIL